MHESEDPQIVWPWEKLCACISSSVVHGTVQTSLRGVEASRGSRCRIVSFVESVRADNNNWKISSVTSSIASSFSLKSGSPQRALEVGNTGRQLATSCRVQGWVTLDIDVETGAKIRSVAQFGAALNIVAFKGVQPKVGILRDTRAEIRKGLHISRVRVGCLLSLGVEWLVALEGSYSIRIRDGLPKA